ncbi:unnamed protein product [Prorocentrum cordatum]|uniref:Uncharacterized protein n=1 Tax=Prorocentrum cordatum TaxID=2364126 RepID=A0ABN9SID5_9DINO|nr:unnamed protein product [Polarella glacialis]
MRRVGYDVTLSEIDRLVASMDQVCVMRELESSGEECLVYIDAFIAALIDLRELQGRERWTDMVRAAFQKLSRGRAGKLKLGALIEELCGTDDEVCTAQMEDEVGAAGVPCETGFDECEIDFEEFQDIIDSDHASFQLHLYDPMLEKCITLVIALRAARRSPASGALRHHT